MLWPAHSGYIVSSRRFARLLRTFASPTTLVLADARYLPSFHLAVPYDLCILLRFGKDRGLMPSVRACVPHIRKRQLKEVELETESPPQPTAKRPKLEEQRQNSKDADNTGYPVPFGKICPSSGSLAVLSENSIEEQSGLLPLYHLIGLARRISTFRV